DKEMAENFGQRVLVPIVGAAGRLAKKVTPIDARDRIARKLLLAGSPAGWDAERGIAVQIIGAFGGLGGGRAVASLAEVSRMAGSVVVALLGVAGFILPDSLVSSRVDDRQKEILRTLSDTLDLLTISVEAGLALNAAIAQVVQNVPGVLSQEFARMLQEIQL